MNGILGTSKFCGQVLVQQLLCKTVKLSEFSAKHDKVKTEMHTSQHKTSIRDLSQRRQESKQQMNSVNPLISQQCCWLEDKLLLGT